MPRRGRFMWPYAVAGVGLRYLSINFSVIFGHPLRNPLQTAFRRVEIFRLHSDWCANLMALAQVCTECVNVANMMPGCASLAAIRVCGAQPKQGLGCGRTVGSGAVHTLVGIGRVHRSVLGSLYPLKITAPLNITSHLSLSNTTFQPILQSR
jgi:hypothetical protein